MTRYEGPPPTIAYLRAGGVTAARVNCTNINCFRMKVVPFDAIGLPDDTPFPEIATRRRWVCEKCGSRKVDVMPDWPDPRAEHLRRMREGR